MDILLCNGLGIELGLFVARKWYNDDPRFFTRDWLGQGLYDFGSICLKFKRLFIQFTPGSLTPMYWEPLSSITRFIQINAFIVAAILLDFNAFILKLFLFIPTEHSLNVYRLILCTLFFLVSTKQYYLYLSNDKCKKLGSQVWICLVILVMETALSYKCAPSPFPQTPQINKILWTLAGIGYIVFTYVMFRDLKHVKVQ